MRIDMITPEWVLYILWAATGSAFTAVAFKYRDFRGHKTNG